MSNNPLVLPVADTPGFVVPVVVSGQIVDGEVSIEGGAQGLSRRLRVAAGQTDAVLQIVAGAADDYLEGLVIVPATLSPGAVSLTNGSGGSETIFTGGANSVGDLSPRAVPVGAYSSGGSWKVTTGANVSVFATGRFS